MSSVVPMVTSKEPSHQAAAHPFTEISRSSTIEQPQYPAASKSSSTNPSDDQTAVPLGRVPSMESVGVRKKGRYEAHDRVDQYLLLQVSRHVQADTVELLAEYLGVSEEQYVDSRSTRTQPANNRAQAFKVCTAIGMDFN